MERGRSLLLVLAWGREQQTARLWLKMLFGFLMAHSDADTGAYVQNHGTLPCFSITDNVVYRM